MGRANSWRSVGLKRSLDASSIRASLPRSSRTSARGEIEGHSRSSSAEKVSLAAISRSSQGSLASVFPDALSF